MSVSKVSQYHHSIDTAKLFFIYLVVVFHSRLLDGIANHGYIGVEFFFIVSGFFIRQDAERYKGRIFTYIGGRIRKLYPHYLLSLVIMLVLAVAMDEYQAENYDLLAELFMLQGLGFTCGGIKYPCWYLSVLFYGSIVILLMQHYLPKFLNCILGIILPVVYFAYSIIVEDGRAEIWNYFHGLYLPILRGVADMALGVLVYELFVVISKNGFYKRKNLIRTVELISFLFVAWLILCPLNFDSLAVIGICVFLLSILHEQSVFAMIGRMKFVRSLSKYEYAVFLNHALVVMIFLKYIIGTVPLRVAVLLVMLIVTVTVYSSITSTIISKIVPEKKK